VFVRTRVRRVLTTLLPVLMVGVGTFGTASAQAAPEWGITMEHHNAYGAQRAECPGGHESLPGESDCGVDPFTDSGTTFDRESGFNEYEITVSNAGNESGGAQTADIGQLVTCGSGTWTNAPTAFVYQWLRGGEPIASATSSSYTTQPADTGKIIQCRVTAINAGGSSAAIASGGTANPATPISVVPVSIASLPTPPSSIVSPVGTASGAGNTLECKAGKWGNAPESYSYVWLRNGIEIAETANSPAVTSTYTLTAADVAGPAAFQCQVTGNNTAGSVAIVSRNLSTSSPAPVPSSTPPVVGTRTNRPLTGALLSVADALPQGLVLAGQFEEEEVGGSGWECSINSATSVNCIRSEATTLAPGASYPPITLHVHVNDDAPFGAPPGGGVTNVVTVYGGGASPAAATVSDPTMIAEVPFGVQSFTTSVLDSLEDPFTQADGHPFAANASFVFNYISDDAGRLRTAGGSPDDIETELPPGFVGNPQAAAKCPTATFEQNLSITPCPLDTAVGYIIFSNEGGRISSGRPEPFANITGWVPIYDVTPTPGEPAAFGFIGGLSFAHYTLKPTVRSNGDYGITIATDHTATPTLLGAKVTFCDSGVAEAEVGFNKTFSCAPASPNGTPFLSNIDRCSTTAPVTTLRANTYEDASGYAAIESYAGAASAPPSFVGQLATSGTPGPGTSFVTGCDDPELATNFGMSSIDLTPETTMADAPVGVAFDLKMPQTSEVDKLATPDLRDTTVTLPEGMTVNPSAADGLQACTDAQFGLGLKTEPAVAGDCPSASQVGTAIVKSPLLEAPLEGRVFVGEPECSPCSAGDAEDGRVFRLFLEVEDPTAGVIVKLAGSVAASATTGQLTATFRENPQLPFEDLKLRLDGGPRAPLATPQACGTATTKSVLAPWSSEPGSNETAGTPNATPWSSFNVDWDGHGGACPENLPFSPSFLAQAGSPGAGQFSPFSVSFGRPQPASEGEERDEQDFAGITVSTPPGLLGKIAGVEQCPEAQANAGECSQGSAIGTTTVGAGAGADPFYLNGTVYLTGPYRGAPFGLSVVVPAKAGPFTLAGTNGQGDVVVRAAIAVNPSTAALTITSDPLPQIVDGVPLRLHSVRIDVNRPDFTLNPTSCAAQRVSAGIAGEPVNAGEQARVVSVSSPFAVASCASLLFSPVFSASTQGATSKANGASLIVKVASAAGQANIAKVDLQLPKALPARLTTLQKACTEAQFDTNPAGCPEASVIGMAKALTPVLSSPLTGPAYLVSHGGAAFPDVMFVLQGEGVRIDLDGATDIKNGITYSRFESVPDAPISSFETVLPEGPHSVLATDIPSSAKSSLCGQKLVMPTTITAQNGRQIVQNTTIAVTGCKVTKAKPLTRAQKLTRALKACRAKYKKTKRKRLTCEKQAHKKYGAKPKSKQAGKINRRSER
jgi:hypothetical protein